eukprot:1137080-Pyramimonas_sp.AAC.1
MPTRQSAHIVTSPIVARMLMLAESTLAALLRPVRASWRFLRLSSGSTAGISPIRAGALVQVATSCIVGPRPWASVCTAPPGL